MLFVAARLARIGRKKKKLNVFKKGRRAAVSIKPPEREKFGEDERKKIAD
jgi:hypothetical protein